MKWVLLVMLINGGVDSVEFDTERACVNAVIHLNLKAASAILKQDGYTPHVDAACKPKGEAQ